MKHVFIGLALFAAAVPNALIAQQNCAERTAVIEKLEASYGETFAGGGLQNATHIFEVWYSHNKGTWTILRTRANGTTCIMASGTNWRQLPLTENPPASSES